MSRLEPRFTIRGWHVAAAVVAFFAVIIAVDALFLTLAYRSHPGQVASKPYEAGLVYNAELERQRAQARLGWRVGAEARPEGVFVRVVDRDGRPLSGLELTVTLQRPATEQGMMTLGMAETAPGEYAATLTEPTGVWDARVEAVDEQGRRFAAGRRLSWR